MVNVIIELLDPTLFGIQPNETLASSIAVKKFIF